jgi:carbon storage regulator CsrA
MLVLSRRVNEKIVFPDLLTSVQVLGIRSGTVRLGIEAPPEVAIRREEVQERMAQWEDKAPAPASAAAEDERQKLRQLVSNRLRITSIGLEVLRQKIRTGRIDDAEIILDVIGDDCRLLQQRLEGETQAQPAMPPKTRQQKVCRALVVEDDPNQRELLAGFLRLAGMDVSTAGDGTDALDRLHRCERPDIVLLDMGMPRCDGATMVRELRSDPEYANLKIFAVTGHLPEEYDLCCGPGGVDRWFHKPINPVELVQDLNQELDRTTCCL